MSVRAAAAARLSGVDLEALSARLRTFVRSALPPLAPAAADEPRISIICPSYNKAEFLERTLLSILNQRYPNLEIIIMDAGSNDGSLDIIRRYQDRIAYWVSEKDNGQSDAINKGLAHATGSIIGWQNADDLYCPGAFRRVAEAFRARPDAVLVSGNVADIDREETIRWVSKFTKPTAQDLLYQGMVMSSQGVFWKREVHEKIGAFDVDLHHAMDFDFWLRVLSVGEAVFVPEILGGFRVYEESKTGAFGERGTAEVNRIRAAHGINVGSPAFRIRAAARRAHRLAAWFPSRRLVTLP